MTRDYFNPGLDHKLSVWRREVNSNRATTKASLRIALGGTAVCAADIVPLAVWQNQVTGGAMVIGGAITTLYLGIAAAVHGIGSTARHELASAEAELEAARQS